MADQAQAVNFASMFMPVSMSEPGGPQEASATPASHAAAAAAAAVAAGVDGVERSSGSGFLAPGLAGTSGRQALMSDVLMQVRQLGAVRGRYVGLITLSYSIIQRTI